MPSIPFISRRKTQVALVRCAGMIGARSRLPGGSGFNDAGLAPVLERAFSARRVQAVALVINSPGGSPAQCALITARIRHLASRHDIPVCAFVEDIAASGGYWLACSADEIFALDSSIVGSIGVINAGFGFADALARIGVERRVHATGKHKGMLDPFLPEREEDVAILDTILLDLHAQFVERVKRSRGARLAAVDEEVFSSAIWTGCQAREMGLIDGIGDAGTVLRERFGDDVRIREYSPARGWLKMRGSSQGAWTEDLLERIEARLLFNRYGL